MNTLILQCAVHIIEYGKQTDKTGQGHSTCTEISQSSKYWS